MNARTSRNTDFVDNDDRRLDDLLEEIGKLVEAGDVVAAEAVIDDHPQYASRLRRVLPAIEAMAAFDDVAASHVDQLKVDTVSSAPIAEKVLGDFRILREVGRGGMGVVYEARQISLGRRVALKVLPYAGLLDARQLERFQNEARVAAALHHTNIVPVYTVGSERGVYYYAMQFIEGRDLAAIVEDVRQSKLAARQTASTDDDTRAQEADAPADGETPTVRNAQAQDETPVAGDTADYLFKAVQWAASAADALFYAHSVGVLHRDIKPANLLLDHADTIWVSDFGLARLDSDASLTVTGDLLGTLRYMSPEQAGGDLTSVDNRSDIYALGATLYELLTLHPAQPAADRGQLLRDIIHRDPPPPSRFEPRIARDLDAIVQKAIEKDRNDRYQTAEALAADLRNFLENRPVTARAPSLASRTRKWLRRHQSVVRASVVTLTITSLASALLLAAAYRSERAQRDLAESHGNLAQLAVDEMLTKVAVTWAPGEPAVSAVQRQFLERALKIYQHLAKYPADGDAGGESAAAVHERIADIHGYLGDTSAGIDVLETALRIRSRAADHNAVTAGRAADLVRCHRKLAECHSAAWNRVAAEESVIQGIDQAERILLLRPRAPRLQRELSWLLYLRAKFLLEAEQVNEAAEVLMHPGARFIDSLNPKSTTSLSDLVHGASWHVLRSRILRRQDRLAEAAEVARSGMVRYGETRNSMYYDSKRLLELDADLHRELAESLLAQGKLNPAVDEYRAALGLWQQRLGGQSATQLMLAVQFDRQRRFSSRSFEGLALAGYIETQLGLAPALALSGRPYECCSMAGKAFLSAGALQGTWPSDPRFWVLHANAAAVVGDALASIDDSDADHYLQLAAALWHEIRAQFVRSEEYVSGVHDSADWHWFRKSYPELASQGDMPGSDPIVDMATPFVQRVRGRVWFERQDWQGAVYFFSKSAELRESGHAYDWLHMAMSYHRLGKLDEAEQFHKRAVAQVRKLQHRDAELESLLRESTEVLALDASLDAK